MKVILKGLEFVYDTFFQKSFEREYMCLFMDDYLLVKVTDTDINIMKINFSCTKFNFTSFTSISSLPIRDLI